MSASSCHQEVDPKGRVWNCVGGGNGENPAGSVSPWRQRWAGRQNSPKWAAVGAKDNPCLCIRYRMHFWRRKPWIHSQFYYTGLGVPAFRLHLLFPTLLPVCSSRTWGFEVTFHLLHGVLQNTWYTARNQSPYEQEESTRAGCGPEPCAGSSSETQQRLSWSLYHVLCSKGHKAAAFGVCLFNTFANSIKCTTQERFNSGITSSCCEPHLSHGKFCYYFYFLMAGAAALDSSDYVSFNTCGNTNTFLCVLPIPDPPEEWFLQGSLGCLHLPPVRCGLFSPSNRHPKLAFAGSPWPVTPTSSMIYMLG